MKLSRIFPTAFEGVDDLLGCRLLRGEEWIVRGDLTPVAADLFGDIAKHVRERILVAQHLVLQAQEDASLASTPRKPDVIAAFTSG